MSEKKNDMSGECTSEYVHIGVCVRCGANTGAIVIDRMGSLESRVVELGEIIAAAAESTRLEASLAELQGRVAAALMRLEEAQDDRGIPDGVGYTYLCEAAIAILRDESASECLPTCPQALRTLEAD